MKKSTFCYLSLVFLFFSCSGTAHLPVPGEKNAVESNISVEYYSIASSYEELKNYKKAIDYYNLAKKNKKMRASSEYKIARCYALLKDWDNAQAGFEKILKKDPSNTNIKISLAYIMAMRGDLEASSQLYSTLVSENSTDVSILKNYISVLCARGMFDEANVQLAVLKEKFPDDADISRIEKKLQELSAPKFEEKTDENSQSSVTTDSSES
ncbi:tetratricopeptide repeat protein [uncultured Treponema sp.]|uniref:tetratricopeptide repeat protein n=1 Tax=uncultured Treponema sp. TaxID=162155 RepID=UPI002598314E|nr:tetratricopeptide repeat protein [uncultured Treponema sp.]